MNLLAWIVVIVASVLAVWLTYAASPYQRRLRKPLAAFPARVSALLAAVVALRAWVEALGIASGALIWLIGVVVVLAAFRKSVWAA